MTSIYVLIIIAHIGYGTAIDHLEFNSLELCEDAAKQLEKHNFSGDTNARCFKK